MVFRLAASASPGAGGGGKRGEAGGAVVRNANPWPPPDWVTQILWGWGLPSPPRGSDTGSGLRTLS